METLEELKRIRDNAPEGATHYDGKKYFRFEMFEHGQAYLIIKNGVWCQGLPAYPVYSCRSLSDINRIIWQREMLELVWPVVKEAGYGDFCSELRNYMEGDL